MDIPHIKMGKQKISVRNCSCSASINSERMKVLITFGEGITTVEVIHDLGAEEGIKRREVSLEEKSQNLKWLSYCYKSVLFLEGEFYSA